MRRLPGLNTITVQSHERALPKPKAKPKNASKVAAPSHVTIERADNGGFIVRSAGADFSDKPTTHTFAGIGEAAGYLQSVFGEDA